MFDLSHQLETLRRALWILPIAAILSAAVGYLRPVRGTLVPRSSNMIQTQVLLSIVGAIIIIAVAESLARAFAIVGAAGLVRYRARIRDPKDAGVLLVALAIGLLTGTGLLLPATFCTLFVILVLWLLESLEPADRTQFDLTVESKDATKVRPHVEHALRKRSVQFQLCGSSPTELRYEVTVPLGHKLGRLSKLIRSVDKQDGIDVDWRIRKPKTLQT
jgi:uncharacterized membrane protein YhiD involved in acid resistance